MKSELCLQLKSMWKMKASQARERQGHRGRNGHCLDTVKESLGLTQKKKTKRSELLRRKNMLNF